MEYEATYVHDDSLRRQAIRDLLGTEDPWFIAFGVLLAVALLVIVISPALRLPAAVLFGFAAAYFAWRLRSLIVAARHAPRRVTVTFSADNLAVSSAAGEATYRWSAVRRIALARRFIFVFIGRQPLALPRTSLSPAAQAFVVETARAQGATIRGRL